MALRKRIITNLNRNMKKKGRAANSMKKSAQKFSDAAGEAGLRSDTARMRSLNEKAGFLNFTAGHLKKQRRRLKKVRDFLRK